MQIITFQLHITAEEFLRYYRGTAQAVIVRSDDGRRIQLPARNFRPFLTESGISGRFRIRLDDNNRLVEMVRLG
jgi:hypothetical protein